MSETSNCLNPEGFNITLNKQQNLVTAILQYAVSLTVERLRNVP